MTPQQPPTKDSTYQRPGLSRKLRQWRLRVRVSLWDFFLLFRNHQTQTAPDSVSILNHQGVFLSPQRAKALANVLTQNITQYESAFGEIKLEAQQPAGKVIQ